jgi:predicted phosphodiesterase
MPDTVRIGDHTFAVTGAFVRDVQSDRLSLRAWAPTPNIRVIQPGNSNQVTVQVENLPTRVRLEASGPVAQERDGLIRTLRFSPKATRRLGFIDAERQVSFAVLGDTGDSPTFIQALRLAASRGADFLIHAGDLIYRDEQMPHIRDILATSPLPVFTVRGNHDYRTTARIAAELRTDSDKGMRMNIIETRALTKVFPGRTAVANLNLEVQVGDSTVVICHARVSMVPLDQPEYADTDQGVCDGIADCDICAGGDRPRGGLPRPL